MPMIDHLLDYHYWARDRVLDAVAMLTPEQHSGSRQQLQVRARYGGAPCSAEWVWHQRWTGSPTSPIPFDRFPDVASAPRPGVNWRRTCALDGELARDGREQVIDYKLINGQPGRSVYWQMLQHVVNHASYHRGQITTMLRQLAAPPKGMDMIAFYREHLPTR